MAFSEEEDDDDSSDEELDNARSGDKYKQRKRDEKKPYNQVKHVFDINVRQIQQMPLLAKFIRDADDFEQAS